jgi:uncharacterized Fe-S cluster-containing radical SAM superfamily protein
MSALIDTDKFSSQLRDKAVDLIGQRVRVTTFAGSQQEADITLPLNCHGFGRVHRFKRRSNTTWPDNPLPIEPACRALRLEHTNEISAQVFQSAVCNWRCWYCYVDFKLLLGDQRYSSFISAGQLVDSYMELPVKPPVIDLSGGQPDLVPEWTLWMMKALTERGMDRNMFLWGDDNLSNDYFWRFLSESDRAEIAGFSNYARVCCFKGFDPESFSFNTAAHQDLYWRQLELFKKLLSTGIDLYAYVTLTGPSADRLDEKIKRFVDDLQQIHVNLPLRTVPLEIHAYTPMQSRSTNLDAVNGVQQGAVNAWLEELDRRFPAVERERNICEVRLS